MSAVTPFTLNAGANRVEANSLTNFGDLGIGKAVPLANISGRVLTAEGRGVRNATVTMTDPLNVERRAVTGPYGFYQFTNVPTDVQYTFGVYSRRFNFAPQNVIVLSPYSELNFVSSP